MNIQKNLKITLKYLKVAFLLTALICIINPAYSIDESILNKLDNNNIYYYDPTGEDCTGTTSPLAPLITTGDNLALLTDPVLASATPELKSLYPNLTDDHIISLPDPTSTDGQTTSNSATKNPTSSTTTDQTTLTSNLPDPSTLPEILVLSLADPALTRSTLNQILNFYPDKYLFLLTAAADPLTRPDLDFTAHNNLLRQAALDNSQVFIIDWAATIKNQESTYLTPPETTTETTETTTTPETTNETLETPENSSKTTTAGLLPNQAGRTLLATTIKSTLESNYPSTREISDTLTQSSLPTSTLTYLENAGVKEKVASNLEIYQTVAAEKNLPWQLLAAIHFREANLDPTKSLLNGDPIKSYSYTNRDGQTTATSLLADARLAADHLIAMGQSVYGVSLSTSSSTADLSKAVLAYGRGYMYKNATPEATYDQSPYIMNGYDEQHLYMRWLHADSYSGTKKLNSLEGKTETRPGLLAVMAYLGTELAGTTSLPVCGVEYTASVTAGGDILDEGGMTLDQARVFMMRYGENLLDDSKNTVGAAHWNACNGGGSNCATFSHFFVTKFSSTPYGGGNGNAVVGNLASNGAHTGSAPAVYAVLSTGSSSKYGHTAVVLGHHGNEWYVGHASCSSPNKGKGNGTKEGGGSGWVFVETSDNPADWNWVKSDVKFAYLDGIDTNKIQEYINHGP